MKSFFQPVRDGLNFSPLEGDLYQINETWPDSRFVQCDKSKHEEFCVEKKL